MNISQVQYNQAIEENTKLRENLKKERERNDAIVDALAEVTQHNIALRSELKSIGGNINLVG